MSTPRIIDQGHTWPSIERATQRAERISTLFDLPVSSLVEAAKSGEEVTISPFDILDTLYASNKDMLYSHVDDGRHFLISLIKDTQQSDALREMFETDHDEAERHRLGQPWRNHTTGNRVALAARLSDSNAAQGVAIFDKKTSLVMEERDLIYRYQIELANFYVTPTARVRGLAYALATAIALEIDTDIRNIRKAMLKADQIYKNKVKLEFEIGGEPYTVGGARLARQIVESMTYSIERTFSHSEVERFCDGQALEEDFTLMYTFFDEVGDPPEKLDYSVVGAPEDDMWEPSP
jgi:hypothetical protein